MTLFEHRTQRLLPMRGFLRRVARFGAVGAGIVGVSLGIGAAGYHHFGPLPWVDALLNAAMILTGMGPVDRMDTTAGKLFATAYALYSGIAFLTTAAVLFAPILHRILHSLHIDLEDEETKGASE